MNSLYIVIPAYNEEANIGQVLEDWYPVAERHPGGGKSRILAVNDGSRDSTLSILREFAADHPYLEVVDKENGGHGSSCLAGYRRALDAGAEFIFQTDSDGQTDPAEFEAFWERRNDYDMVIGSRRKREDGFSRIIVTRVLRMVLKRIFHVRVEDANTPYRLMSADALAYAYARIPENFNLANVALSVILVKKQKKVHFIPITFRKRAGGKNSINLKKIFRIGRQAVKDFKELNRKLEAEP